MLEFDYKSHLCEAHSKLVHYLIKLMPEHITKSQQFGGGDGRQGMRRKMKRIFFLVYTHWRKGEKKQ